MKKMKSFLEYLLESPFSNKEIYKHSGKYLKNVIDQILKTKTVMLGSTTDDMRTVQVDDAVLAQLKDIDLHTADVS